MRDRIYFRDGTLFVLPDPGSARSPEVQLALGLRNEATLAGRCPVCGAHGPNRAERRRLARRNRGRVVTRPVWHAPDCPAGDVRLGELIHEAGEWAA
jgi:hypothetical protein